MSRFSRYVYAIARRGFRLTEQDAADVFQDVFTCVYEQLDTLRDDAAVRGWLGRVTRRLCVDHLRSASARTGLRLDEFEPAGVDERLAAFEETQGVWEALQRLPAPCRELLDRFYCRDESYRSIAAALGLPPGTVASRLSRCLDKLRLALGPQALLEARSSP